MPLGANKAAIMGVSGVSTGDVVLLSSQTASNSASLSFTSGIDSTYGEYIFKFYNIGPATDTADFTFQVNATDSTSYDETITSTTFYTKHEEGDATALAYGPGWDQAQGTAYQLLTDGTGNGADESCVGDLHIFNPASTTYVKHFTGVINQYHSDDMTFELFLGGYINTTTAIDDIQFKMSTGNFDGTIKMWGVK